MDIDELMRAPGIRWVFRAYAIAIGLAGFLLFGWGPMWLGLDLPGLPFYKASLIRVAGGVMMTVACLVAALDGIEAPRARRRALFWLAVGHSLLFLVVLSQRLAVWHGDEGKLALLVLFGSVFAFFFLWSGRDVDTSCRDQLTTLFGSGDGAETLEQRYQRQIRAAALQEERHRLAGDLHDSVKQQIFAIQAAAATAQARFDTDPAGTRDALDQVRGAARDAMAEVEAMLDQLRAAPLETVGFVESVRKQAEALGLRSGSRVDFQVGGAVSGLNVAAGAQEALFRVAQEALANIGRHARAANVKVAIFGDPHFLRLTIEDDGQGLSTEKIKHAALKKGFITPEKALALDAKQVFSLLFQPGFSTVENATKDAGRGVGMNLMAGLMQQIGGKVSVATVPGKFTRLTLSLPPVKRAGNTEAA